MDIDLAVDQGFDIAAGTEVDATDAISGTHVLTKIGGGRLVLMGDGSFTGGTQINDGAVEVRTKFGLGTGEIDINAPGELDLSGTVQILNTVRNNSTGAGIRSLSGHNEIHAPVVFGANTTFDVSAGSILELESSITEATPAGTLTKVGAGELWLDAENYYTGGTDIKAGTIETWDPSATGIQGLIYVEAGATLELGSSLTAPATGIYMGGTIAHSTIQNVPGYSPTLNGTIHLIGNADFAPSGGTLTISGDIGGTGTVTVPAASDGTVVMAGVSSYIGQTVVAGGTLQIDGDFTSSTKVNVLGGTLTGDGSVSKIVATGGTVSPGDSPGTLRASSIDIEAGATYQGVLNSTTPGSGYSVLSVTGAVTINGGTLSFTPNFAPGRATPSRSSTTPAAARCPALSAACRRAISSPRAATTSPSATSAETATTSPSRTCSAPRRRSPAASHPPSPARPSRSSPTCRRCSSARPGRSRSRTTAAFCPTAR